jgi:hypothetical protein
MEETGKKNVALCFKVSFIVADVSENSNLTNIFCFLLYDLAASYVCFTLWVPVS